MGREKKGLFWMTLLLLLAVGGGYFYWSLKEKPVIKIGIIHSLTGTMAISEKFAVRGPLLAIEEINKKGGVLEGNWSLLYVDGKERKK